MKFRKMVLMATLLALLAGCSRRYNSGDRVLVAKYLYDTNIKKPERFDVVVFKYPKDPTEKGVPKNYIKRLLGLPGEVIAIFFGQLFAYTPDKGELPFDDSKIDPLELWDIDKVHRKNETFEKWFNQGKFEIIRKPPAVMMAMRRIVYDNDHQAKDMTDYRRWQPSPDSNWVAEDDYRKFRNDGSGDKVDWLRYAHITRARPNGDGKPQKRLISDLMGYNALIKPTRFGPEVEANSLGLNWAGDLMLECDLNVVKPEGEFLMELSRGIYRLQAVFDLKTGKCTLRKQGPDGTWKDLKTADTTVSSAGSYQLRLANFDSQLTLWVNGRLPFGDGVPYPPPEMPGPDDKDITEQQLRARRGPTANDLQPASLGSKGANVEVSHLRLWRDTYYGADPSPSNESDVGLTWNDWRDRDWTNPEQLNIFKDLSKFDAFYVHPSHFLCLGDNSSKSADSRSWGLVPKRLMLGRALLVYFPFNRVGPIR